jgi:hypothetical protein
MNATDLLAAVLALDIHAPKESAGKMTWTDIKAMFPAPSLHEKPGRDGLLSLSRATAKMHRHEIGAAFKPRNLLGISPAEYRHRHLGKS